MIRSLLRVSLFLFVAVPATAEVGGAVQKIIPQAHLTQYDGALGVCKLMDPGDVWKFNPNSAMYDIHPATYAGILAHDYLKKLDANKIWTSVDTAVVTVLSNPMHGLLVGDGDNIDYHPNTDTVDGGGDKFSLLVEVGGYKIKVLYSIYFAAAGTDENWEARLCPAGSTYQIPLAQETKPVSINIAPLDNGTLASTQGTTIP